MAVIIRFLILQKADHNLDGRDLRNKKNADKWNCMIVKILCYGWIMSPFSEEMVGPKNTLNSTQEDSGKDEKLQEKLIKILASGFSLVCMRKS